MGPLENSRKVLGDDVPYWDDLLAHTTYDEFWRSRAITPHLERVPPAVLTVGGWFDAEDLAGAAGRLSAIEAKNPGVDNHLVMGPWSHGGWSVGKGDQLGRAVVRQQHRRVLPRPASSSRSSTPT